MSEVKVNKISPRIDCGTVTVGDAGDSVTVTAGVPVTVNGDLKSNALKAVDGGSIISQCGTNITLGASGDTINLAAGATQTGFGRTGTVDWDTTAKTAGFTAVSGTGYFVNTTSGAITVTLPATPSAGDIVAVADYANTADTNNITIDRNGSPIEGNTVNPIISAKGGTITLVYVDGTQGWRPINSANSADLPIPALFTVATGGTETTCGDFKIHTFTGPGTFCVSQVGNNACNPAGGPSDLEYLVIAGGGGGAAQNTSARGGGGGGAGGYRTSAFGPAPLQGTALTATASPYPVSVGSGGAGGSGVDGSQGANSIFSTITSTGGGGGTGRVLGPGQPGGSGGGAGDGGGGPFPGGSGNTPPVSPPQGNNGGTNFTNPNPNGGGGAGGGGAGGAGTNESSPGGYPAPGTPGGPGVPNNITGSDVTYAEGAAGGPTNNSPNASGPANSGDGGVGGGGGYPGGSPATGGSGGSGIVVIRYKYQ